MSSSVLFDTPEEVYAFLNRHGATQTLLHHAQVVAETAQILGNKLKDVGIPLDQDFVIVGAALHDAGKIKHPEELSQPGNLHESTGETFLLEFGIEDKLARVCRSHNQWKTLPCSLEELTIALADNLWKGKRNDDLEQIFLARIHTLLPEKQHWEIFIELDSCFESIAISGDSRLLQD